MIPTRAYAVYEKPMSIQTNKMFTIIGFIRSKDKSEAYTRLKVEVDSFDGLKEVSDLFYVYFRSDIKKFIDKYTEKKLLINITGEIVISSKSTNINQVLILEGKHVTLYKNYVNVYDAPSPHYVDKGNIKKNSDLAY